MERTASHGMYRRVLRIVAAPAMILLLLSAASAVSAAPAGGDSGTVVGLYEGRVHNEFEHGLALQIYDGRKRHLLFCRNYALPDVLRGRIGHTVRVEWRAARHDSEGVLPFVQGVTLVAGRDDPELDRIRTAAEEEGDGAARARNTLGVWYEKGRHGLPKDPAEAVRWYTAAAEAGEPLAMHNLGDCHRDGVGVPQDEARAVEWYNRAIEAGNPIGYEDLGDLHMRRGRKDAARAMYRKAADAGRASARKKLAEPR